MSTKWDIRVLVREKRKRTKYRTSLDGIISREHSLRTPQETSIFYMSTKAQYRDELQYIFDMISFKVSLGLFYYQ